MRVGSRVCAFGCLAAVMGAAWPAAAAMTLALRDEHGQTRTFYQDGSRIRIANPSGTDDGEARIVDLKTTEHVVVYDDAKAYYDYNKTLAPLHAAIEQLKKTHQLDRPGPAPTIKVRALGENRQLNGFTCAMYEQIVDGQVDEQICFAPWGGTVGAPEDFAWFDQLMARSIGEATSEADRRSKGHASMLGRKEGLPVWESSAKKDGSRGLMEIVKLSRDPLPAELFHVPSDYTESPRALSASEHPKLAPPPIDVPSSRARSSSRVSGQFAVLLGFVLVIGLLIQAALLHLAATLVLERARFTQAFVAAAIMAGVLVIVRVFGLPPLLSLPFGIFTVFAALKISYGASIGRTLALFFVSILIAAGIAMLGRACTPARATPVTEPRGSTGLADGLDRPEPR